MASKIYLNKLEKSIPDTVTKLIVPGVDQQYEFDKIEEVVLKDKYDTAQNRKNLIEGNIADVNYSYIEELRTENNGDLNDHERHPKIQASLFRNSEIENFAFPDWTSNWEIGESAFRDSKLKTITNRLPACSVKSYAFANIPATSFELKIRYIEGEGILDGADNLENIDIFTHMYTGDLADNFIRDLRSRPKLKTVSYDDRYDATPPTIDDGGLNYLIGHFGDNTVARRYNGTNGKVLLIAQDATNIGSTSTDVNSSISSMFSIGEEAAVRGGTYSNLSIIGGIKKIEDRAFSGIELNSFNFGSVRELGSDTFKNSLFGVAELEFPETLQTFSGAGNFVGTNITKVISRNYEPISFTSGSGADFPLDMEFYVPLGTLIKYCPNTGTTTEWTEQGHGAKIFEYIHSVYNIHDGMGPDGSDIYGADVYFYVTDTTSASYSTDTRVENDGEVVEYGILLLGAEEVSQ